VEAVEMYVDFLRHNRHTFEATQVQQDGVLRSQASERQKDYFAFPEVRDLLDRYMNKAIEA
jgi:hypothetical protein